MTTDLIRERVEDEPEGGGRASGTLSGNLKLDDVAIGGRLSSEASPSDGVSGERNVVDASPLEPSNVSRFITVPETSAAQRDLDLRYKIGEVATLAQGAPGEAPGEATPSGEPASPGTLSHPTREIAEGLDSAGPDMRLDGEAPGAVLATSIGTAEGKATVSGSGAAIRNVFLPDFNNDEATSNGRTDILDVTADAMAFAQLAASRSTRPPLAVGVFGSWGAGKSFFMDLVHGQVEKVAQSAEARSEPTPVSRAFHDKVTQIRFNAWHYAETNLWASLVGHIFQELSAKTLPTTREDVFGKLSTARRLTLEASATLIQARKEEGVAKSGLEDAKTSLAAAKARPLRTANLFADMMVGAFSDKDNPEVAAARADLMAAARDLGAGTVITSSQELTDEGAALLRQGIQGKDMFWSIAKNMGSPGGAALFVFALVLAPLLAIELLRLGTEYLQLARSWASEAFVSSAALAAILAGWFKKAAGPMLKAVEKLKAAKARVDAHVSKHLEKYERVVAENEAAVAKASASVQAASDMLKAATARVAQAREELHGQSAAGRLISFVRDRAANGEYAKHLGLVSTIRKDFEELSNFVSGKASNPQGSTKEDIKHIRRQVAEIIVEARKGNLLTADEEADLKALARTYKAKPLPFERIVLYIDDVDRCPPAKVVEVLQAVHMLLAFKLFVVFVAVDVRWVASSLAQQYQGILKDVNAATSLTSASDYLEKIFQIPYWLPTVNQVSSDALVSKMLPISQGTALEPRKDERSANSSHRVQQAVAAIEDRFLSMEFNEREVEQVQAFARLLDSPRKVIRFTNVVRFLRARDRLRQKSSFETEAVPILAQLAIATASPETYSLWQLVARAYQGVPVSGLLSYLGPGYLARYPVILASLEAFQKRFGADAKVDVLLESGALAGRLSFSAPLPDGDGKLFAVIKSFVDKGETDFPLLDEIKARSLGDHRPAPRHFEADNPGAI